MGGPSPRLAERGRDDRLGRRRGQTRRNWGDVCDGANQRLRDWRRSICCLLQLNWGVRRGRAESEDRHSCNARYGSRLRASGGRMARRSTLTADTAPVDRASVRARRPHFGVEPVHHQLHDGRHVRRCPRAFDDAPPPHLLGRQPYSRIRQRF